MQSVQDIVGKLFAKFLKTISKLFVKVGKLFKSNIIPVTLFPVPILFNSVFKFLDDNNLLSSNQRGFRPSDFCEYQFQRLIYKLQSLGISSLLLKFIEIFLSNRFQRVLLNGQSSSWPPRIYLP